MEKQPSTVDLKQHQENLHAFLNPEDKLPQIDKKTFITAIIIGGAAVTALIASLFCTQYPGKE